MRQTSYVLSNGMWQVVEDVKLVNDPVLFGRHVAELNATNNSVVRAYIWGLDLSETLDGAGGVGGLLRVRVATGAAPGTHFVSYDGNGNLWNLVSASTGTQTARYEYGPFGEQLRLSGPAVKANPFRFSTKRTEDFTGLVLYEYRAYSPTLGRWLSRDPIEEVGGLGLFVFIVNAPVRSADSLGLQMAPPGWPWPTDPSRPFPRPMPELPKPPQYPRGFAICQRDIAVDGICDYPGILGNMAGGEHCYVQYVDSEGNKWGWGFGGKGTIEEMHFRPNSCVTCEKANTSLKHGSGKGKVGTTATDAEVQDCIKNYPPRKPYKAWGKGRYNCKDWAWEAATSCGLTCN